jgi:hypothetical protein
MFTNQIKEKLEFCFLNLLVSMEAAARKQRQIHGRPGPSHAAAAKGRFPD